MVYINVDASKRLVSLVVSNVGASGICCGIRMRHVLKDTFFMDLSLAFFLFLGFAPLLGLFLLAVFFCDSLPLLRGFLFLLLALFFRL